MALAGRFGMAGKAKDSLLLLPYFLSDLLGLINATGVGFQE